MDTKKLEKWANQLLDTGKRNNLINFKDVKSSTVEIVSPSIDEIFDKVDSSATFEVYDPKITDDDFELPVDNVEEIIPVKKVPRLNREEYIEFYSSKIKKKSQMLIFSEFINPISALKMIDKKAREYSEETGVNVAYIAFGFINWKDKDDTLDTYRAPILLAPITLKNESNIKPWYVQMTEEDVIVNPTFNYKLNSEHGVTLPEYCGGTFDEYISEVENIVAKLGWSVSRDSKIGIFSFQKINMYQDLKSHQGTILGNNNVRMLLGEEFETQGISISKGEHHLDNPLIELHNVVDADSSQIEAIEMAKAGVSFVLQGPPGTGKSQTITNIIAECIGDGKKVLFVSEKQAALNVVFDKLKKAGLEEFCLELHSHKANKKEFISNLVKTLNTSKTIVSNRAEQEIANKLKYQQKLDEYEKELHLNRDVINMSLYQMYNAFSSCRKSPELKVTIKNVNEKSDEYLHEALNLLAQYVDFVPSIGYQYKNNPWYGYNNLDTSYQMREELKACLEDSIKLFEGYLELEKSVREKYEVECNTLSNSVLWENFFDLASTSEILTPAFMKQATCLYLLEKLELMSTLAIDIVRCRNEINSEYDAEIYQIDAIDYNKRLTRQFTNSFGRLFNSEYKKIITDIRINRKNGKKPSYAEAIALTEKLNTYHEKSKEYISLEEPIRKSLGSAYEGVDSDWDMLIKQVEQLRELYDSGTACSKLESISVEDYNGKKDDFDAIADRIEELQDNGTTCLELLLKSFDKNLFDIESTTFDKVLKKLRLCLDEFDRLDNWCRFNNLMHKLEVNEIIGFVDASIDANIQTEDVGGAFQRNFYAQWIDYVLHLTPVLSEFNRIAHDKSVALFGKEDTTQFDISKAQIRARIAAKRPALEMVAAGSAVQILLREGQKQRKLKSIRGLMDVAGELIQVLKPCFMMSPLSVSTYLNPDTVDFDVVVFDEASQIFPQDAIGAIYRGKQLIVVGDSKQMPPSNFFHASNDSDDDFDEEIGDVADFESILDLCTATLPQKRLNWHYRSKYEQLIAFSNKNFYDGGLITFPSSVIDREGVGVDFHYCETGVFENKINRNEAELVVDLIFKHFEMYPNRSLGVVAFSISQQDLIDRLLSKRRQIDTSKENFFSRELAEPFFIKNLETVQGDERDTIIFSVGYAKNGRGVLNHNFGPLNRVGGERRLNVAITRAKHNVQLVSSIHHTDIDLSRTSANGARLLKEYLDFAENGTIALDRAVDVNSYDQFDSEFEQEVCAFLRDKGYQVDTQVGCSNFKIDLGLKRPNTSDYVLAIECDGATYHSSKNARDRDRLRQQILESMGWNFYRIWSTDWFKNGVVERERLLNAVEKALNNKVNDDVDENEEDIDNQTVVFEEIKEKKQLKFPEYIEADIPKLYDSCDNFQELIKQVLQLEAPLSEEWLLKRIAWMFGRDKVTSVVQREFESRMYQCQNNGIIRKNGFLYISGNNRYILRVPGKNGNKRDIGYIAVEEIVAGMMVFIEQNVTVSKEGLYKAIANALGFQRTTENMAFRFDMALSRLRSYAEIDGEIISLKSR